MENKHPFYYQNYDTPKLDFNRHNCQAFIKDFMRIQNFLIDESRVDVYAGQTLKYLFK